jgi:hypothetical protein
MAGYENEVYRVLPIKQILKQIMKQVLAVERVSASPYK